MQKFETIRSYAEAKKGGADALEALLAETPKPKDFGHLGDDRILSEFTKRIFQAGFNWSVVEKKWDGFEAAFHNFDIGRNAFMSDDDFDAHLRNTDIVRNATKILTVRDNAIFLSDVAKEHGSAARYISDWPSSDLIGLWALLKKRGARLGGASAQYALRFLGKDCFILSQDVTAALQRAGVIEGSATSKRAQNAIQDTFNSWREETGESYTRLSRICAMSV
ncbi:MAG: DNA-3-methyladenine glycosylase I [Pseudomonadota bacterium]